MTVLAKWVEWKDTGVLPSGWTTRQNASAVTKSMNKRGITLEMARQMLASDVK